MAADLQEKRRDAREAVLLTHRHDERQQFFEYLMGATWVSQRAYPSSGTIFDDAAGRHRLRGEVLTRRLRGPHDVSGPEKRENLTVAIFEQPDRAYDTLQDLNVMALMLTLPKQCTSAWNAGNDAKRPAGRSTIDWKFGGERWSIAKRVVGKRMCAHE